MREVLLNHPLQHSTFYHASYSCVERHIRSSFFLIKTHNILTVVRKFRIQLTLDIEFLIFFRHSASSSLDSKAHCTQVPGGCKYLQWSRKCAFKPQCFKISKTMLYCISDICSIYIFKYFYRCMIISILLVFLKQTFHTACRNALWLALEFPRRCLPECAGRQHTYLLGWEELERHKCSTGCRTILQQRNIIKSDIIYVCILSADFFH